MTGWEQFVLHTPWFIDPGDVIVVDDEVPWPRRPVDSLPRLSALLETATLTALTLSGRPYELISWGPAEERRGWLCEPPRAAEPGRVHPTHGAFWSVCGGIVERYREPGGRWMNHNAVLTDAAARELIADVLDQYRWIWEDEKLQVPIDPDDYYVVAVEANGNLTLVHRRSGELLLFAPDHDFDGVTPFRGSPAYSLMTIDGVPDLASWIEESAGAWLNA